MFFFFFLPAGAEDDFVCLDLAFGADQGHVDQILLMQELLEELLYVGLMVVPS